MESLIEKALALKKVSIFENLSAEALRLLASACEETESRRNEIILNEGEASATLHIIVSGSVNVIRNFGGKTEKHLATLTTGGYFGEMNLFDGDPHSATVVAAENCRLFCIRRDPLREIIDLHPPLALEILRGFSLRLRSANRREENASIKGGETRG
ncbi:MAG: cyclic nucleotide-binding domain-containing protein [Candidatus Riflebacteria bacterium]|nr:cyclic nucleotide-binding domain-containing protein [Candidatus Riflebacteria bacterium]